MVAAIPPEVSELAFSRHNFQTEGFIENLREEKPIPLP